MTAIKLSDAEALDLFHGKTVTRIGGPTIKISLIHPLEGKDSFYKTVTESRQWSEWLKYQYDLFAHHTVKKHKKFTGCFDVDESMETGCISPEHFQDFLQYCDI